MFDDHAADGSSDGDCGWTGEQGGQRGIQGVENCGQTRTFYVALNGNDSWSGLLPDPNFSKTDGPFATIDRARAAVGLLDKSSLTRVIVQIRGGVYYLSKSLQFSAADSGSPGVEIVYENYPYESPVISGGMRVQNWTHMGDNKWRATLPASNQYFENLFYNGQRRLRPRLGGYLGTYLHVESPYYATTSSKTCPASQQTPSGYKCFDRFHYAEGDPISSAWTNLAAPTNPANPNCDAPNGSKSPQGDIELIDFEQFTVSKLRVSCVDTANRVVYLTGPTTIQPTGTGFTTGHRYLVENVEDALTEPGQWFLDRSSMPLTLTYLANDGEDPNRDTVIVPQLLQVMVASGLHNVIFRGLTFQHDNFIVPFAGYQSTDMNETISAAVSFQNSQDILFGANIVTQTAGAGLEFLVCGEPDSPLWCAPTTGIIPQTTRNRVEASAFYDLGASGVRIGMPEDPSDTDEDLPQFLTVENSVVEGYGRTFPSTFGIAQGMGHDNLYTHNDVYEGYHVGISICVCGSDPTMSSGPANNTVSFNHVHDTHQGILNDGGAIRIAAGNQAFTAAGNKILNNKVHDVNSASALDGSNNDPSCVPSPTLPCDGYGGDGIYLDNSSGLIDVENNLVYRVSENAVNFPKTPPMPNEANTIKNNILAFARASMINDSTPYPTGDVPNLTFVATSNLLYFDRSATSPQVPFYVQGGCTFYGGAGYTYTDYQQWNGNLYYRTDNAFGSDPGAFHVQPKVGADQVCTGNMHDWTFLYFACSATQSPCWQGLGEDALGVVKNPGFANPNYPADDYSLPHGSPIDGFYLFDPSLAGRVFPRIYPPPVPATFQTKTFNPSTDF